MWIRVKTDDGPNFSIPIPLSLAGSRMILKLASKYGGSEVNKYAPMAHGMVRELRRYVRENGHFTMVDVESADGTVVKITI